MRRLLLGGLTALWCSVVLAGCGGSDPEGPSARVDVSAPVAAAVAAAESVTVVAVGDIACASDEKVTATTCQQDATARLTAELAPEAVIGLGDLQYEEGSVKDFMESYNEAWGALRPITRPLPGNHEYNSDEAEGYFDYFDQGQPWYAWDAGSWRIYMLNSNCEAVDCDAEVAWLTADLAEHPTQCSAIAAHYPRYSSSRHGSNASMARFWQPAYDAHVDVALAGHDHNYERFAPMDATGDLSPGRGITSFVSGTGGKSLYEQHDVETGSAYFQSTHFGVLELKLSPRAFTWTYTTIDGEVLDTGHAPCV